MDGKARAEDWGCHPQTPGCLRRVNSTASGDFGLEGHAPSARKNRAKLPPFLSIPSKLVRVRRRCTCRATPSALGPRSCHAIVLLLLLAFMRMRPRHPALDLAGYPPGYPARSSSGLSALQCRAGGCATSARHFRGGLRPPGGEDIPPTTSSCGAPPVASGARPLQKAPAAKRVP